MNPFKDELINDRYEVMNLANHATDTRSILNLNNLRDLTETERQQSALLINRSVDAALNLLNFNCCHYIEPPVINH